MQLEIQAKKEKIRPKNLQNVQAGCNFNGFPLAKAWYYRTSDVHFGGRVGVGNGCPGVIGFALEGENRVQVFFFSGRFC